MSNDVKLSHALHVVSRLEMMKEHAMACDFTIKVAEKVFPVHRTVLIACSEYFEKLFSSKMKESQEGFVEMKEIEVGAFENALEFMYSGATDVTMKAVQDIIYIAELLQLSGLKKLCFFYLLDNLSPGNCLFVMNLATMYSRPDVKEAAENTLLSNFSIVISSEAFPSISKLDLLRFISGIDHETKWKAIKMWTGDVNEFTILLNAVNLEKFPFHFLLYTVLEDPLVKQSECAKGCAISALFSDSVKLKAGLTVDNCFDVKFLSSQHGIEKSIDNIIISFMEENFDRISQKSQFSMIEEDSIVRLFQSPGLATDYEKMKWNAAVRWSNFHLQSRKQIFPKLLTLIKLEKLPFEFLKTVVRSDPLVNESPACSAILMDALFVKSSQVETDKLNSERKLATVTESPKLETNTEKKGNEKDAPVMLTDGALDVQPADGTMTACCVMQVLPGYEHFSYGSIEVTYCFPAGQMKGIRYSSAEFHSYLPNTSYGREICLRLKQAFNAGQIFKLRLHSGRNEAEVVWGSIHVIKNVKDKNDNPGHDHLAALDDELKRMGFYSHGVAWSLDSLV